MHIALKNLTQLKFDLTLLLTGEVGDDDLSRLDYQVSATCG